MEQGFGTCGSGPSGKNVIRPGASGAPHPDGSYEATSSGPVAGFDTLDDVAGQIGPDGVGHGHFSQDPTGQSNTPGPWKQT
jgi:hypothetical protein